jgi:hypothetical protein
MVKLLRKTRKYSCEAESDRVNRSYSGMDTNLLGRGALLVRGGNYSEGLLKGTPWRVFSCEAETPRKASRRNSSEGLLVRGRRKSCERAYSKKLFGYGKTSRMNGIPTLEHRLSDLKHDFLASTQDLVCR